MKAVTWLASFTVGVASLTAPAFANTLEGWSTDLDKALADAKAGKKSVLAYLLKPVLRAKSVALSER